MAQDNVVLREPARPEGTGGELLVCPECHTQIGRAYSGGGRLVVTCPGCKKEVTLALTEIWGQVRGTEVKWTAEMWRRPNLT
jgi:hypothetical protein